MLEKQGKFIRFMLAWLCFCACHIANAKGEVAVRPLVVYSPHGPEILKSIADQFSAKHRGLKVDWRFYGAEEILDLLRKEKDAPIADVWWGGPQFMFIAARNENLLEKLPQEFGKAFGVDSNSLYWVGDMQTPITIFYQTDLATKIKKPTDWNDLLSAPYKNKIALRSPESSGTMRAFIVAMIDHQMSQGKSLEEALTWLKRLDDQAGRYYGHSQQMLQNVAKGLQAFGIWNIPEIAMRMRQGFALDYIFPASGMPMIIDGFAQIKRATKHPALNKFSEFVLSKEVAKELAKNPYNRLPLHRGLSPAELPPYTRQTNFKPLKVDWERVAKDSGIWLQKWDAAFASPRRKK